MLSDTNGHIKTPFRKLSELQIDDEYWKTWINPDDSDTEPLSGDDWERYVAWSTRTTYLMRSLYQHPLTSNAHFATARVLNFAGEQERKARHQELLLAVQKCTDPAQKAEIFVALSREGLADEDSISEDWEVLYQKESQQALHYIDSAIELTPDKTSKTRHSALLRRLSLLQDIYDGICDSSIDSEIVEIFKEIRTYSQEPLVDGESVLRQEMLYYGNDNVRIMDFFVGLSPTQRLSLLLYGYGSWNFTPNDLNGVLLPAALSTERTAELTQIYNEMLRDLKLGNCEINWYPTLARYYKALQMYSKRGVF